jgi:type II secretory pathway component PulF
MASFTYRAKQGLNQDVEGQIEANNQKEALNKLIAQGLFPVSIKETAPRPPAQTAPKKTPSPPQAPKKVRKRITSKEVLVFTQKLATLTRAKVGLFSALKIIYDQTENETFREILLEINNGIKEGKAFSESLGRFPGVFPPIFVNVVRSGETSGRLDSALDQISEFLSREESLKTRIVVALAYPALLSVVGLISIFVLINFVIPKLKPMFASLGKDLPLITKIVLNFSAFSNKVWLWIFVAAAAPAVFIYYKKGSRFFAGLAMALKTRLPVVKRLVKNQELAHFSRSLAMLLNSGVAALKALEIATPTIEEPVLRRELENVCANVAAGESLSKSLGDLTGLPAFFVKMIAVGEESGRLDGVLLEISRSYTQQIEADIALVSSLIEPVLILTLGLILGTIVLSILLPIFQVTQVIR